MHRFNGILVALVLAACGCNGERRPSSGAPVTDPAAVPRVTHPTAPGHYRAGAWDYEYRVWGDTLKHGHGTLKYDGRAVSFPMGSVLNTALGKFMSFDVQGGGQQGYNTGWLMTAYIHDVERSNAVVPVFLPDGTVNPSVLDTLPIQKEAVTEVRWPAG